MRERSTVAGTRLRHRLGSWVSLALLGAMLGAPGPGALVALVSLFSGHDAHAISLEQDVTHADLVLCHDGAAPADAALPAFAARDCEDDHRVHVASAESAVLRGEGKQPLAFSTTAAVVPTAVIASRPVARIATPVFDAALADASRIHRTIVLRL